VPGLPAPPTNSPCHGCEHLGDCEAYKTLSRLIYSKPGYAKPEMAAKYLPPPKARAVLDLLGRCVSTWMATVASADLDERLKRLSLPALFDVLMSGLYATVLFAGPGARPTKSALIHHGPESWAYFPYIWMCPACVAGGAEPRDAYIPGATLKAHGRMYPVEDLLARPQGRMIGDFGALCIRAIVGAIAAPGAHLAVGGGHRGEFDLIVANRDLLVLGETKASPLVAFPVAARLPIDHGEHHTWGAGVFDAAERWTLFVGAAPEDRRHLPLSSPSGPSWPLPDLLTLAGDGAKVELLLRAWRSHLDGYRLFNDEAPGTRWHRFGCGNIELKGAPAGTAKQLRVDNTKNLPGIDRTDDIKKGAAQVMLFDRLKPGCRAGAVKTVLFGNLYAETHHKHYVKPIASLRLLWPNRPPVWLFDAIVALTRNIFNDRQVEALFGLANEPYADDEPDGDELLAITAEVADGES
jgi:hypothetical protein